MKFKQSMEQLLSNLQALDTQKKIGLGVAFLALFIGVITLTSFLASPVMVPIYSNLSRQDSNAISRALSESGIDFAIDDGSGDVKVRPGAVTTARMTLAEYGLPSSPESGYELFDNINSLGLTTFMQDVTNKRAIQGELARTIKMITGVNSARVHLVMAENKNVFRRNGNISPSASLVLKTIGPLPARTIRAIRHMVAAAVPGLDSDNVTIVGASGTMLSAKTDGTSGENSRLVDLENNFSREAENKIALALGAHLGSSNFRVTVTAKLNNDQRRIEETTFDPDSRFERSVQIVREKGTTENKSTNNPASVTENLPDEGSKDKSGQISQENSDRREELTNYDINEKKVSVVSSGYRIENLSVALVVNKSRINDILGANAGQPEIAAKIEELKKIARSTLSMSDDRGDQLSVSFVEFLPEEIIQADTESSVIASYLSQRFESILSGLAFVVAALIFTLLGIRPLLAFLQKDMTRAQNNLISQGEAAGAAGNPENQIMLEQSETTGAIAGNDNGADTQLQSIIHREEKIKNQLEEMVAQNEKRVARAIKQWLQQEGAKTI